MKGLYVHIPFCTSICFYCDFKRSIYQSEIVDQYLIQLEEDIKKIAPTDIDTVYIGGGTPSALNIEQLKHLLDILRPYLDQAKEVSIESNLESLTDEKITLFEQANVNRISLGVQSLNNSLLKEMNRKHTKEDVLKTLQMIEEHGIHNISVDMIYGFQNQSLEIFLKDLNELCTYPQISHISMYSLTIEENSVFHKMGVQLIDNELEALMYHKGIEVLEANGFKRYEIANFAKTNKQSLHNLHYWHYDDFYGVGLGASGKEDMVRYTIEGTMNEYITQNKIRVEEQLDVHDQMFEEIMMSLRLVEGLDINRFNRRYDVDFMKMFEQELQQLMKQNHIEITNHHCVVKPSAMIQLHEILLVFLGEQS